MVIVAGSLHVDPDRREEYLTGVIDRMHTTRTEPGCLEYTYSADPSNPGRVMIIERWASQEHFDAHIALAKARPPSANRSAKPSGAAVFIYDVTGERRLG